MKITVYLLRRLILSIALCLIFPFSGFGQVSILYDFANDAIGAAPANVYPELSSKLTTPTTVLTTSALPITKGMKINAGTTAAYPSSVTFGNFPAVENDSVIWGEVITNSAKRGGMILRAQPQAYYYPSTTYPVCRNGYLFQVNGSTNGTCRIYVINGTSATILGTNYSVSLATNTKYWFKAVANGTSLGFYYSPVSRKGPWTLMVSATNSTWTKGYTSWTENYGVNALGYAVIDSVQMFSINGAAASLKLDPPHSLNSTNTTATAVTLSWTAPITKSALPVLKYKIYRNGTYVGSSTGTSYTDTGLASSTTYTYAITDSVGITGGESVKTTAALGDLSVTTLPSVSGDLTITNPVTYQVIQRNMDTNTADIKVAGTYTGTATGIEASWNGGAYQTIVSSPSGGVYSGKLTGQKTGQGTLSVRFTNAPEIVRTITTVGIGDIFIVYGQSNSDGRGALHTYTSPSTGMKASLFSAGLNTGQNGSTIPTNSWINLQDNNYTPDLATYLLAKNPNVPVGFVKRAQGGQPISNFAPGASNYISLTTAINQAIGTQNGNALALLWYQGESDTNISTSVSSYLNSWTQILNGIRSLTNNSIVGLAGVMGTDQYTSTTKPLQADSIRNAQLKSYSMPNNLPGAIMIDNCGNGLHYDNAYSLDFMGYRWFQAIDKYIYNNSIADGYPQVVPSSVLYNATARTIELTFNHELAGSGIPLKASNDNGPVTINSLPNGAAFNIHTNGTTTSSYTAGKAAITAVSLKTDKKTVVLTLASGTVINSTSTLSYGSDWNGQRTAGSSYNGAGTGSSYPSTSGGNSLYSLNTFMPACPFYNIKINTLPTALEVTPDFSDFYIFQDRVSKSILLNFDSPDTGYVVMNIFNVEGKLLYSLKDKKSYENYKTHIDISNIPLGVYIFTFRSTQCVRKAKFIVR